MRLPNSVRYVRRCLDVRIRRARSDLLERERGDDALMAFADGAISMI